MRPVGLGSLPAVPWPTQTPDSYFAERGFALRVYEDKAERDWSADIVSPDGTRIVSERYGSGATAGEAALRAQRRYHVEQDPDPPRPHRLP
jgi:hypothetical protein